MALKSIYMGTEDRTKNCQNQLLAKTREEAYTVL